MALVRVKDRYQVTLPTALRQKAGVVVGDFLEATVRGKTITLTPRAVVDRELARSLAEFKRGRYIGPFRTAKAAVRGLRRAAR